MNKNMKKAEKIEIAVRLTALVILVGLVLALLSGCSYEEANLNDTQKQQVVQEVLKDNQATPTDIDYSLERYNLIKRAYWVNGQREKAMSLPCAIERPLGYIVLFSDSGAVVGRYVVDGKVTSLNSYLSPDSEYYEISSEYTRYNGWLADVDGSYGENDSGIFFFTTDGNYFEWTGTYLYTDVPVQVDNPLVYVEGSRNE